MTKLRNYSGERYKMCLNIQDCAYALIPKFSAVSAYCPVEMDHSVQLVSYVAAQNSSGMCENATLHTTIDAEFQSGAFHRLALCALHAFSFDQMYVSFLAWAPFRSLLCGAPTLEPPAALRSTGASQFRLWQNVLLGCMLLVALLATACKFRWRIERPGRFDRRACLAWILLCLASAPAVLSRARSIDVNGFYYHDAVTECAFELERHLPDAGMRNRITTIAARSPDSLKLAYLAANRLPVWNKTLYDLCGHCTLNAFGLETNTPLNEFILLGESAPPSEAAMASIIVPPFVPAAWRLEWTERFSDHVRGMRGF